MGASPTAIDVRHMRYFLAVVEELHFRRAATRMHMSQPPLSQAIRKLEEELGVALLHRTSRVVTPTAAGQVFAEEARKVLASVDLAVAEARRAGGASPALRVGCVPHLPIERLLGFLSALRERDPSSLADVTHISALEQIKRLRIGELDLGIFHCAQQDHDIEVEALFAGEPLAAILPPAHRLNAKEVLGPDDLRQEALVIFPRAANPALHDRMLALIHGGGYRFMRVRESAGTNARDSIVAVAEGAGVALAPSWLPDTNGTSDIVIRHSLDPPVPMPDIVIAWRVNPPGQLRKALATLRDVAKELYRASRARQLQHQDVGDISAPLTVLDASG